MKEEKELNFEEAIQQLEEIANCLEKGNLSLEESVSKFEEGMELSKRCNSFLESAEKRISILVQQEDGELTEENFKRSEE